MTSSHDFTSVARDVLGSFRPRPNLTRPKAKPNRYLSKNARKAHQRQTQAHQRRVACLVAQVEATTAFVRSRLREPSFASVLFGRGRASCL